MAALLVALAAFLLAQAPQKPTTTACGAARSLLASVVVLAPDSEPGPRFTLSGRVLDYTGRPLSKAAVVAYQADAGGVYNAPASPTRVPRLRAVAVTADDGSFAFRTVVPGEYPNLSEPAHIHLEVAAPAHHVKYVDIWFAGDPLITPERLARPLQPGAATFIVPHPAGRDPIAAQCDIQLTPN